MILKTERQEVKKRTETENPNSTSFTSKLEAPNKTNTQQTVLSAMPGNEAKQPVQFCQWLL